MRIGSYLPVFPGFYDTIFESDEEPYIEDGKTWDDYNWDYKGYNDRVARACVNYVETELKGFGIPIECRFQSISSPREYNFGNDSINVEYVINKTTFDTLYEYLENNLDAFYAYLKERYTPCSGFIPYHSTSASEWMEILRTKDESLLTHKFGAILDFVFRNEIDDPEESMYCGTD